MIRDAVQSDPLGAEQSFSSRNTPADPPETFVPQLVLRFDGPAIAAASLHLTRRRHERHLRPGANDRARGS